MELVRGQIQGQAWCCQGMYPMIGKDKCISLDNPPGLMRRLSEQTRRVELKLTDAKVGIWNWYADRYRGKLGVARGCIQR
jgi:hypothetical protein